MRLVRYRRLIQWAARTTLLWVVEVGALLGLAYLLPGVTLLEWYSPLLAVMAIGLLNATLWPTLVYLTLPITVLTMGFLTLVLNGFTVWLTAWFVPGFELRSFGEALLIPLWLTAVNTLVSTLLSLDDDASFYQMVVRRQLRQRLGQGATNTSAPGLLFLEIDGLAEPLLRRAMAEGYMPTLTRWLVQGSHQLVGWECDFASQTAASQAGILYGDNFNIPAFRWYEKDTGRLIVANRPGNSAYIEQNRPRPGLLHPAGVSRCNLFSGGAPDSLYTLSTLTKQWNIRGYYPYFLNPYNFARALLLMVWELVIELSAAARQRFQQHTPRMKRGGAYPLIRAMATIFLRELTVYTLIGDMFAGVPVGYASFVGYDEVAHHSGIATADALAVLYRLDQQLARLEKASQHAPRPYHFVILSDHGQSQGATFKQRYNLTLEGLVHQLVAEKSTVEAVAAASEGWGYVNAILTEAIHDREQWPRILQQAVERHTQDEALLFGPEYSHPVRQLAGQEANTPGRILVLASGNLGLIYFTHTAVRLTYEEMTHSYPNLIPGLTQHEGVGFVLVQSGRYGPLAIGAKGVYFLERGYFEGENPLAVFGSHAPHHAQRLASFPHTADIMVNSFYNPYTEEVCAFEELIGSHGGLGGTQMHPFILYPAHFTPPPQPLVGAEKVYHLFQQWLSELENTPFTRP